MQLQQISLVSAGMASPLRIASATVQFTPNEIILDRIFGNWEGTRTTFDGSVRIARRCSAEACPVTFDLRANELDIDDLNRQLNPRFRATDWLALPRRLIGGEQRRESALAALNASGTLSAGRVTIKALVAQRASANVALQNGVLRATDVRADLYGGRHIGTWSADFNGDKPAFEGSGAVDDIAVAQVAVAARNSLGTGTLTGDYRLAFTGDTPAAIAASAVGSGRFDWRNGLLRQITVNGDPLAFSHWTGVADIADSKIALIRGEIQTRKGTLLTTGTVGFDRALAVTLAGERQTLMLSGTLEKPLVEIQAPAANAIAAAPASKQNNDVQKPVR
jgi:hypothetical protein